ncbi:MAG: AAA domain-containing protein, partial [Bacilli bacterium]|nr:AAA domain-containing protein [Bacilli bacterium]
MKQSIGSIIYQAINERKWLDITYGNKEDAPTHFWFAISDIDFEKDKIQGEIFNFYKSTECIDNPRPINRKKILSAKLVEGSYYEPPQDLLKKIEENKDKIEWLDIDTFDNNILLYLSECYKYDNDPFIDDAVMIPGIDYSELVKAGTYQLSQEQFEKMLDAVLMMNPLDAEKSLRHRTLAFNIYSIDIFGKQYVVAYRELQLDFKHKTLRIANKSSINNSFLIEEKRYTLGSYLTIDPNDFCENFDHNITQYVALMEENYKDGERSDTRPSIFLLQRSIQTGLEEAFNAIYLMSREKKLTQPIKAFFGANSARSGTSKEPYIVVFDKKIINIDQIRVVYNSMVNHITYVQGPPGTGKTETIFNVLLSAYANGKKCIVCSNNNNPIENIFAKMTSSFRRKNFNSTEYEEIFFPIIRIGNIEENKKTILKLRSILNFLDKKANLFVDGSRTAISKESALSQYNALKGILKEYEDRQDVSSIISMLESWKTINKNKTILNEIEKQIEKQREKIANLIDISDEDVANNVVSSEDSFKFMNYLYYSSIETLRRIENKTYKELRDII